MPIAVASDPQVSVQQLVKKVTTLATLPEVTLKIIRTVEDPKSSAQQLHKIVSHDPALVTRILKVVNSAFYGLPGQIASVERAIVLLGLNAVKNIAVAASLGQLFRGVSLCEGYTAKDLWTHCVSVAVVSRELARQMKAPIADEAFLAGMVHDIGILVSMQINPEQLREVCERAKLADRDLAEVEREVSGIDHQMLGMALTEQWKFPRSCQLVAGYHHKPESLSDSSRLLVSLVYIADTLCCQAGVGFSLTARHQDLNVLTSEPRPDASMIERVRNDLPNILADSASVFT